MNKSITFEDRFLRKVTTDNGTEVWVRGVPPYTMNEVYEEYTRPDPPIVELESDAGVQRKMALPGSTEYLEYQDRLREWNTQVRKAQMDHHIQYGVVKWRFPWDVKEIPWYAPPKQWKVPDAISKYFPEPTEEQRRLIFIKTCILVTQEDIEAIDTVLYSIKPVAKESVDAALVPTPSRSGDETQNLDQ